MGAGVGLIVIALSAGLALRQLIALAGAPWMATPSAWASADPLEAIVFVAWAMAMAAAGWLLFSIALAVVATATGFRPLEVLSGWTTIPAVRRLAHRVTVVSLVVSTLATPAVALAQQTPPIPIIAVVDSPDRPASVSTQPSDQSQPPKPDLTPPIEPAAAVRPRPAELAPPLDLPTTQSTNGSDSAVAAETGTHIVTPGESLWTISHDAVHVLLDRTPSNQEVATYWAIVVAANRTSLRSGNPDLITPGEPVFLPNI